jgi:hypothetical protein
MQVQCEGRVRTAYSPTFPRPSPTRNRESKSGVRHHHDPFSPTLPSELRRWVRRSWGAGVDAFYSWCAPPPFSWLVESELMRVLMVCVLGGVLLPLEREGTSRRRRCRMPNLLLAAGCWLAGCWLAGRVVQPYVVAALRRGSACWLCSAASVWWWSAWCL